MKNSAPKKATPKPDKPAKVAKEAKPAKSAKAAPKKEKAPAAKKEKAVAVKKVKAPAAAKKETASKPRKKAVAEKTEASGIALAKIIAQGMYEKKAEDITILDMRNVKGASADYFVISHASNDKQVEAIANSAEDEVKKLTGETPLSREGYENLEWVLLDYFDVVAHVFQEEKRHFYAVEELWGDALVVPFKGK